MTSIFYKFRSKGLISSTTYKGEKMKTKFNLLIALFVIMAIGNSSAVAQTIHPVSAGDGTLTAAVDAASPGDIVELVDDGGLYTETGSIYIDKPLTVRAQEGLTQRPIIQILQEWGASGIFQIKSGGSLVLKGVELDGLYVDEAEVSNKYCIRTSEPAAEADSFHYALKVDDCVLHHPKEVAFKEYPFTIADTLLFTNCIFDEVHNEAIHLYNGGEVKYLMVDNCTFTRVGREAVKVSDTDPVIRINHCTFDSISWRENKRVLYPIDVTDVEIKNSIFTNQLGTHSEVVSLFGNSTISYCDTFEVGGIATEGSATIGSGMLGVDPLYTDPANDDYTLATDSPVLGMADDGLTMGDLRWIPVTPEPTVWEVAAGTDVLKPAIDGAAAGDIIELVTDGGLYLSADQIVLDKDITILGGATLPNKPVLKYVGTSTGAYMFKGIGSPRIALANLEFDGDGTAEGGAGKAKYVVRLDNADITATMSLFMDNCVAHDFNDKFIKPYPDCGMDSLVVTNSILYNGASEGITLYSGTSADPAVVLADAVIENCTFYNLEREAIKGQTYPDTKVRVNRCTFYNLGEVEKKAMLYFRNMTDVVVKNSIFATNPNTDLEKFADFASDASIFTNNVVWDVTNWDVGAATVTDTLRVDPQFADAANADFTLPVGSALLAFADDGGAIGDPRWIPLAKLFLVEAGDGTIQAALEEAEDGSIIELVTSGGLYTYSGSDKMYIDNIVTIRAREGLAQKPIVKNTKPSATSARIFDIRAGGSLTLIGLDLDGRAIDDMVADNKNIVRSYDLGIVEPDSFHYYLKIDDCILHNTTQTLVRLHEGSTADSVIITNSIFDRADREAILTVPSTTAGEAASVGYLELTNCTFTRIGREALKMALYSPIVRINHCTFDSIGYSGDYRILYPKELSDVEIKNSIFSNQAGTYTKSVELWGSASISYSDTFNVQPVVLNESATVGAGMIDADPQYADPVNGDYRLAAVSPARAVADDGFAMGDLRWEAFPGQYYLTVITEGNGLVELDPPGGVYDAATIVTLTAVPDPFWGLESWTGNVSPSFPPDANPVTVTMNANETVTATFVNLKPKFAFEINSVGVGHVDADPEPLEGGFYEEGATVTLTAVPDSTTWAFVEWEGDVADTLTNPAVVTVDSAMSVTAVFASTLTQFTLDVSVAGLGDVAQDPGPLLGTYDTATVVILTAEPAIGWEFSAWSGDLVSTENPDTVAIDSNMVITANFSEVSVPSGVMAIDTSWDLRDALEFANNHSVIDTLLLTTSGGLYTSTNTSDVKVTAPLVIMAADTLAEKPICTNSDVEGSNDDIFRVFDDFTLIGVVLDAGHASTHGPKYGIRLRHYSDRSVKQGTNVTVMDCDFRDFFEDKVLTKDGHAFKIDVDIVAGGVKFENCTFTNFGYEAIRVSDTEKWVTDRALDSLIVRNCTFTNIDAEGIRYYSDLDAATADAPVIIEHLTFNNSGTRTIYLKNSGGAIVRDIIIANSRISGHGRDGDLMDPQGNTGVPAFVSYIDTFNVLAVSIKSTDGEVDETTVFGADPMFEDAAALNYTLLPASHMYGLAHDGEAMGDLRWATNTPTHKALTLLIVGEGDVEFDPAPVGPFFDDSEVVTMTAVPDTLWEFSAWSGDVTGTTNPTTVTMDAAKSVTVTFTELPVGIDPNELPKEYSLSQNYPNPFNPTTKIKFALKEPGLTTLMVYDILGREVTRLVNRELEAGYYEVILHDRTLASGIYIYRIKSGDFTAVRKMLLVK